MSVAVTKGLLTVVFIRGVIKVKVSVSYILDLLREIKRIDGIHATVVEMIFWMFVPKVTLAKYNERDKYKV